MSRSQNLTLNLLRIVAGLLFMQHGAQKLFGWLGGFGAPGATAELFSQMGLAGVLEFFGGALIVLGLLTRPIAFVLAAEMVWAYFQAHLPQAFFPIQNGGEVALLFCVIYLYIGTRGGGDFSVDAVLSRRAAQPTERTDPAVTTG